VRQESVAESSTLRRSLDQTGNVGNFQHGRHDARRLPRVRQVLELLIRDDALHDVRIDGAEGVIGGVRVGGTSQKVRQGALSDIREADCIARRMVKIESRINMRKQREKVGSVHRPMDSPPPGNDGGTALSMYFLNLEI